MSEYITLAQLRATVFPAGATTVADADLTAAITAASRTIDSLSNRRFYPDADANQVRYYSPDNRAILETDDLVTITKVESDDDGTYAYPNLWTANSDYLAEPLNAAADSEPWTHLHVHPTGRFVLSPWLPRSVKVTGKFGWSAAPAAVIEATTLLAARLVKQARDAPFGVMMFGDQAMRIARMDSTVMALIGPLRRHRNAVG